MPESAPCAMVVVARRTSNAGKEPVWFQRKLTTTPVTKLTVPEYKALH
jgi:hypothetical protein